MQIIKLSIFILLTAVTMSTTNMLPYTPISLYLILGVLAGPISALLLFKKKNWLRAIAAVLVFTGLTGLGNLATSYGRSFLYQQELKHASEIYLTHFAISMLFLISFFVWYYILGRKENNNGF